MIDKSVSGWGRGELPANVRLGEESKIVGRDAFRRFLSQRDDALVIGKCSLADGVNFAVGAQGRIAIGDFCYLSACTLLAEDEVRIGDHVMIGWGTTISDSDFHPLDPAERIRDAIALSPIPEGTLRPRIEARPVAIGDDVYIGPACTILKGITIGRGAFVEPGSVVTRDVPAQAHVRGNPAIIVSAGGDA